MEVLAILGRSISLIAILLGLLLLLFKPSAGFILIIIGIIAWNVLGHYLKKQIEKRENLQSLQRDLEILNDCAKLIESTKNPDTFFSRYHLYMQKLHVLADAEESGDANVSGESMVKKLDVMNTEKQKIETINAFIDRMWSDTCIKAYKLKTDAGRQNRYKKFIEELHKYDYCMPPQCINHYMTVSNNGTGETDRTSQVTHQKDMQNHIPDTDNKYNSTPVIVDKYNNIDRRNINDKVIDAAQQEPASDEYANYICQKFFPDFPERPFISKDRELYTNWEVQVQGFPHSLLQKNKMIRLYDGLLPGHVYMLYWIYFIHRKRIPAFFEYEFGIWFLKEKNFLEEQGYIENDIVTPKGLNAIITHKEIIYEKSNSITTIERIEGLSKQPAQD